MRIYKKRRFGAFGVLVLMLAFTIMLPNTNAQAPDRLENPSSSESVATPEQGKETNQDSRGDSFDPSFKISGFIDSVFQYEDLVDQPEDWRVNTTRGTLRLFASPIEQLDIKVGLVGRLVGGNDSLGYDFFLPVPMREFLLPQVPDYMVSYPENDFYVQEAYATLKLDKFWLRGGRQKFLTGSGYGYNPTDLFNQVNPLDPTYEPDGFDGISAGYDFDRKTGLDIFVRPSENRPPDFSARASFGGDSWEFLTLFSSVERFQIDWQSLNTPEGVTFMEAGGVKGDFARGLRWSQPALGFKKRFNGVEVYGEAGYVFIDPPASSGFFAYQAKNHERVVIGVKPDLGERIEFFAEYLRLGESPGGDQPISLNNMMGYFYGKVLSTTRDNIYAEITLPICRKLDFQILTISGLNHYWGYYNPWLHFKLAPGLRFSVSGYYCPGSEDSQHSNSGLGTHARIRWDF